MNRLTYFTEVEGARLASLFTAEVIDGLARSGGRVSMAMLDLSARRASMIRALNQRGVGVTAWLLLDPDDGYWFNADNVEQAVARYREVRAFITGEGLAVEAIGLDVEAPHDDALALMRLGHRALSALFDRRRSRAAIRRAIERYAALIGEIRADGFIVETYQFPLIADERRARSTFLQRLFGIVDILADREVMMLYQSLLPTPLGGALVDAYGDDADAVAVGITGGGVDFVDDLLGKRRLGHGALLLDLRRARRYTDDLYVFSLEGCVASGYFQRLCDEPIDPVVAPAPLSWLAPLVRGSIRHLLRFERIADRLRAV